jgi:hypothetical protein
MCTADRTTAAIAQLLQSNRRRLQDNLLELLSPGKYTWFHLSVVRVFDRIILGGLVISALPA